MKMLQSMTQHIDQWRRAAIAKDANKKSIGHVLPAHQPRRSQLVNHVCVVLVTAKLALRESSCTARVCCDRSRVHRPQVVLLLAVASLTAMLGDRFYNQPKLDVGTTAPQTIHAPGDAKVIDNKATEAKV
jgi:cyclic-di-AMP phosphodiesterase PgpH